VEGWPSKLGDPLIGHPDVAVRSIGHGGAVGAPRESGASLTAEWATRKGVGDKIVTKTAGIVILITNRPSFAGGAAFDSGT
jgi:hypothetical protein